MGVHLLRPECRPNRDDVTLTAFEALGLIFKKNQGRKFEQQVVLRIVQLMMERKPDGSKKT